MPGLRQIGAVVQAVLLGTGEHMVERADPDVDVGVHEVALGDDEQADHEHRRHREPGRGQRELDGALGEQHVQQVVDPVVADVHLVGHVVDAVQPPEPRTGVAPAVDQVVGQRSEQQRGRDLHPGRQHRTGRGQPADEGRHGHLGQCPADHRQQEVDAVPAPLAHARRPFRFVRNQPFEQGHESDHAEQEELVHPVEVPAQTQGRDGYPHHGDQQERVGDVAQHGSKLFAHDTPFRRPRPNGHQKCSFRY